MAMGDVDRRGFMRLLRPSDPSGDTAKEPAPPPQDPELQQLAALTTALLADVEEEGSEELAAAPLLTKPYDKAFMRVTTRHIVFSIITGFSIIIKTSDVTAL